MSLFGSVAKLAKGAIKGAAAVGKLPVVGGLLKAVPFAGAALTAADIASNFIGSGKSGGGNTGVAGGLPALPGMGGGRMAAMPGAGAPVIVGKRGVLRNDANVPDAIKAFTISKPDLRVAYRSPMKGYVVLHDQNGDAFAIPKPLARMYFHWKPHKKPPISVGEMESLKRAHRTVKKVRKIHGLIHEVSSSVTSHGQVIVHKRHKKGHK